MSATRYLVPGAATLYPPDSDLSVSSHCTYTEATSGSNAISNLSVGIPACK